MDKGLLLRVTEQWKFLLQKKTAAEQERVCSPSVTLAALSEKF